MKYPEVYNAIRACLENDVALGILKQSRLEQNVALTYKKRAWYITHGHRTVEETIADFAF